MLETSEINDLLERLNIPENGRELVLGVRNSPPLRRVSDGESNVTVRFPSKKMGHTIQCESRTAEHVFVVGCEINPDVLEIWDQPASLLLRYTDVKGRNRGHREVVDFLVIENESIYFVQCKKEDELERWANKNPERFSKDSAGYWRSPAGEKSAAEYGLEYRVWVPERESVILYRNAEYLLDYIDNEVPEELQADVVETQKVVSCQSIIRLDRLIDQIGNIDAVHFAIAKLKVIFDWKNDLACRPEVAFVYASSSHMNVHHSSKPMRGYINNPTVELCIGTSCSWDSRDWTVINIGKSTITLQSEQLEIVTLKKDDITRMISSGDLSVKEASDGNNPLTELIQRTSEEQLKDAIDRYERLMLWMEGDKDTAQLSDRTARDWRRRLLDAEVRYGVGFFGLVFDTRTRGNRKSRLSKKQEILLENSFEEDFESGEAINYRAAYVLYKARSDKERTESVSYPTYCARAKQRNKVHQISQRQGKKAAYQISNQHQIREGQELEEPPVHGDRAWEVAHVDHTELEIELYSSITYESLGKPWLTLLIDAYCRYVLAFWMSFEKPSYRGVMMVIRRCVERFKRVPRKIVVDQGSEFHSTYTEVLFARCKIQKLDRPSSEPRYGQPVERMFGTTQSQFVHALKGNTKNRRLLRGLSKSHDPSEQACWPPDQFDDRLEEYLFDVYPRSKHTGIAETPLSRFERSQHISGERTFLRIPYDKAFYMLTIPEVHGRTRKVSKGIVAVSGLEYSGYSRPLGPFNGQTFPIKYDPYEPLYAWGFIEGTWERLICTHDILREYSERNIRLAHMEVTARLSKADKEYRDVPSRLIEFLSDVKAQEKLLVSQKKEKEPAELDLAGLEDDDSAIPVPINISNLEPWDE